MMLRIMQFEETVIHLGLQPWVDNILRILHNFSHHTEAEFNHYYSKYF